MVYAFSKKDYLPEVQNILKHAEDNVTMYIFVKKKMMMASISII